MNILTRPILEINLSQLVENFRYLQSISHNAVCSAVIKDDAYGIGAVKVAQTLYNEANCRNFFIAHAIEAEEIYPYIKDANIYILQGISNDGLDIFQKYKLIPVINSAQQLSFWQNNKIDGVLPALHIDTGLNRLGFREADLKRLENKEEFSLIISHLSCADTKDHFMNSLQVEEFTRLKRVYFPNTKSSLAASDGIFLGQDFTCDMVRLGAAIYGINTAPYRQSKIKNIVKISAPIIQISELKSGNYAGYDASYKASSDRKIAIVSIGYGDGFPRILSNSGKVFFKDKDKIHSSNIIGRVSMDNIICDITGIDNLKVGSLASIVDDFYTIDDLGKDAQTIGYEIISRFGKNQRFVKKYIR